MKTTEHLLSPPPLAELVKVLTPALEANYTHSAISVVQCPDLRAAPFHLAAQGISGRECIADIGGQPNLFPEPRLAETKYSMLTCARHMGMSAKQGMLIGAGAGPWYQIGVNSELAPNFGWEGTYDDVTNLTHYTKVDGSSGSAVCERSPSTDCALMMNLYGSAGLPGDVLKITVKGRKGKGKSFTESIRRALTEEYGERPVSLGGVFVIKAGKTNYHVMPDFPKKPEGQQYTFTGEYQFSTPKKSYPADSYNDRCQTTQRLADIPQL